MASLLYCQHVLKRHLKIVVLLLNSGADPNLRHYKGHTALMLSSYKGYYLYAMVLLIFGADSSIIGPKGLTALDMAASSGHDDIVNLIKEKAKQSAEAAIGTKSCSSTSNTDTQSFNPEYRDSYQR